MRYEHGSRTPSEYDSLRFGRKRALMSYASLVWYYLLWEVGGGKNLEVILCRSILLGTEVVDLLGFKAGLSIKWTSSLETFHVHTGPDPGNYEKLVRKDVCLRLFQRSRPPTRFHSFKMGWKCVRNMVQEVSATQLITNWVSKRVIILILDSFDYGELQLRFRLPQSLSSSPKSL